MTEAKEEVNALQQAKAAHDSGLVTREEYNEVKHVFLEEMKKRVKVGGFQTLGADFPVLPALTRDYILSSLSLSLSVPFAGSFPQGAEEGEEAAAAKEGQERGATSARCAGREATEEAGAGRKVRTEGLQGQDLASHPVAPRRQRPPRLCDDVQAVQASAAGELPKAADARRGLPQR